jgi:hypothetical protein
MTCTLEKLIDCLTPDPAPRPFIALDDFGNTSDPATWTKAFEAAAGAPVHMIADAAPVGAVSYDGPADLRGNGHRLDLSAGTFTLGGTLTALPALWGDIRRGDNSVQFEGPHGLTPGDVFCVWNPAEGSWLNRRPYYHDGDWMRSARVLSATEVQLFGLSPDDYAKDAMECYLMSGARAAVSDLRVVPAASGTFFTIRRRQGVKLRDVSCATGAEDRAILIDQCYDVNTQGISATVVEGNAYPIIFSNCKKVTVTGLHGYSDRHSIAFGGGAGPGAVPTRDTIVSHCHLTNTGDGVGAADAHGNCDNIQYHDCIIDSTANLGGRNVRGHSCRILANALPENGSATWAGEIAGGLFQFSNCELIVSTPATGFGALYFGLVKQVDGAAVGPREDWMLRLDGCTIRHRGENSSTMRAVTIHVGDEDRGEVSPHKIDIRIRGLEIDAQECFAVVGIAGTNDVHDRLTVLIGDDLVAPPATLIAASNAANYDAPMRLPVQTVLHDFEVRQADGLSMMASLPISFPWRYPKRPTITMGVQGVDAGAFNPGASVPTPYAYDLRPEMVRVAIRSAEPFDRDSDTRVAVTARVADF